jgi:hypothetical protein
MKDREKLKERIIAIIDEYYDTVVADEVAEKILQEIEN